MGFVYLLWGGNVFRGRRAVSLSRYKVECLIVRRRYAGRAICIAFSYISYFVCFDIRLFSVIGGFGFCLDRFVWSYGLVSGGLRAGYEVLVRAVFWFYVGCFFFVLGIRIWSGEFSGFARSTTRVGCFVGLGRIGWFRCVIVFFSSFVRKDFGGWFWFRVCLVLFWVVLCV